MVRKLVITFAAIALSLTLSGCDFLNNPEQIEEITSQLCEQNPDSEFCQEGAVGDIADDGIMNIFNTVYDAYLNDDDSFCQDYFAPTNADLFADCETDREGLFPSDLDDYTFESVSEITSLSTEKVFEIQFISNDLLSAYVFTLGITSIDNTHFIKQLEFDLEPIDPTTLDVPLDEAEAFFEQFIIDYLDDTVSNEVICARYFPEEPATDCANERADAILNNMTVALDSFVENDDNFTAELTINSDGSSSETVVEDLEFSYDENGNIVIKFVTEPDAEEPITIALLTVFMTDLLNDFQSTSIPIETTCSLYFYPDQLDFCKEGRAHLEQEGYVQTLSSIIDMGDHYKVSILTTFPNGTTENIELKAWFSYQDGDLKVILEDTEQPMTERDILELLADDFNDLSITPTEVCQTYFNENDNSGCIDSITQDREDGYTVSVNDLYLNENGEYVVEFLFENNDDQRFEKLIVHFIDVDGQIFLEFMPMLLDFDINMLKEFMADLLRDFQDDSQNILTVCQTYFTYDDLSFCLDGHSNMQEEGYTQTLSDLYIHENHYRVVFETTFENDVFYHEMNAYFFYEGDQLKVHLEEIGIDPNSPEVITLNALVSDFNNPNITSEDICQTYFLEDDMDGCVEGVSDLRNRGFIITLNKLDRHDDNSYEVEFIYTNDEEEFMQHLRAFFIYENDQIFIKFESEGPHPDVSYDEANAFFEAFVNDFNAGTYSFEDFTNMYLSPHFDTPFKDVYMMAMEDNLTIHEFELYFDNEYGEYGIVFFFDNGHEEHFNVFLYYDNDMIRADIYYPYHGPEVPYDEVMGFLQELVDHMNNGTYSYEDFRNMYMDPNHQTPFEEFYRMVVEDNVDIRHFELHFDEHNHMYGVHFELIEDSKFYFEAHFYYDENGNIRVDFWYPHHGPEVPYDEAMNHLGELVNGLQSRNYNYDEFRDMFLDTYNQTPFEEVFYLVVEQNLDITHYELHFDEYRQQYGVYFQLSDNSDFYFEAHFFYVENGIRVDIFHGHQEPNVDFDVAWEFVEQFIQDINLGTYSFEDFSWMYLDPNTETPFKDFYLHAIENNLHVQHYELQYDSFNHHYSIYIELSDGFSNHYDAYFFYHDGKLVVDLFFGHYVPEVSYEEAMSFLDGFVNDINSKTYTIDEFMSMYMDPNHNTPFYDLYHFILETEVSIIHHEIYWDDYMNDYELIIELDNNSKYTFTAHFYYQDDGIRVEIYEREQMIDYHQAVEHISNFINDLETISIDEACMRYFDPANQGECISVFEMFTDGQNLINGFELHHDDHYNYFLMIEYIDVNGVMQYLDYPVFFFHVDGVLFFGHHYMPPHIDYYQKEQYINEFTSMFNDATMSTEDVCNKYFPYEFNQPCKDIRNDVQANNLLLWEYHYNFDHHPHFIEFAVYDTNDIIQYYINAEIDFFFNENEEVKADIYHFHEYLPVDPLELEGIIQQIFIDFNDPAITHDDFCQTYGMLFFDCYQLREEIMFQGLSLELLEFHEDMNNTKYFIQYAAFQEGGNYMYPGGFHVSVYYNLDNTLEFHGFADGHHYPDPIFTVEEVYGLFNQMMLDIFDPSIPTDQLHNTYAYWGYHDLLDKRHEFIDMGYVFELHQIKYIIDNPHSFIALYALTLNGEEMMFEAQLEVYHMNEDEIAIDFWPLHHEPSQEDIDAFINTFFNELSTIPTEDEPFCMTYFHEYDHGCNVLLEQLRLDNYVLVLNQDMPDYWHYSNFKVDVYDTSDNYLGSLSFFVMWESDFFGNSRLVIGYNLDDHEIIDQLHQLTHQIFNVGPEDFSIDAFCQDHICHDAFPLNFTPTHIYVEYLYTEPITLFEFNHYVSVFFGNDMGEWEQHDYLIYYTMNSDGTISIQLEFEAKQLSLPQDLIHTDQTTTEMVLDQFIIDIIDPNLSDMAFCELYLFNAYNDDNCMDERQQMILDIVSITYDPLELITDPNGETYFKVTFHLTYADYVEPIETYVIVYQYPDTTDYIVSFFEPHYDTETNQ